MANLRTVCIGALKTLPHSRLPVGVMLRKGWRRPDLRIHFSSTAILLQTSHSPKQSPRLPNAIKLSESEYREHKQPRPPREPFGSGSPNLVVGTVIGVCVSLFVYTTVQRVGYQQNGSNKAYEWLCTFDKHFTLPLNNIKEGRWYVLLTHTLAHANLTHLGLNMLSLWGFGRIVVSWYGLPTFAIIWAGSAVIGGVLQAGYWIKFTDLAIEHKAIGCSGSVFGLVSAMSCVLPTMSVSLMFVPMNLRWLMIISTVVSVASIKEGWLPWLGHVDHLGGMAFGFAWWALALRRGRLGKLVW